MKKIVSSFTLLTLLMLENCASVLSGGSQSVSVKSASGDENIKIKIITPQSVYEKELSTMFTTTPSSFKDTTILVEDKCYEKTEVKVGKSVHPYFWINILFPLGVIVDYLTGEMWKMDKEVMIQTNKKTGCKL